MYLKGIEISGFKSFAKKTEFQFQDGITGIVGPNGSGKSNIADAMRWVLGEQSAKQLRSSNMQDVIFAGTEARKPVGYAYVNIIFDNSDHMLPIDYDEVTIGRRVYRSGESEYLINSSPCRLRQVQELFYDTGVGKEGYSIIGQGQIDKILSGKPEERRELFDEAAGIVKYKKRKSQALSRLEKEKESLDRVDDLLSELESREEPLCKQAQKAKAYLKLHDELRICDVNDYLLENEQVIRENARLGGLIETAGNDVALRQQELSGVKGQYDSLTQESDALHAAVSGMRLELEEKREEESRTLSEITSLRLQLENDADRRLLFEAQAESLEAELSTLKEEELSLQENLADIEASLADGAHKVSALQAHKEQAGESIYETENRISENRRKIASLNQKKSDLLVNRQRFDTMSEQTNLLIAQLNGKILQADGEEKEAARELRRLRGEMKKQEELISSLKEEISDAKENLQVLQAQVGDGRRSVDQAKSRLLSVKARYDSVSNLAERYEGYIQSIKRVMEQKRKFPGIYGVLADLIHVEKRYETAIETALGSALQNIVCDNENTARACINFLKANRAGRATFLPVTTVKSRGDLKDRQALSMTGVCGQADSLIACDDRYREIIRSLLGKILVVDNMEHALLVAARFGYSFRIVTLEGESLNAGGSISGGAFKNNSNLLGRRREIEELSALKEQAKTALTREETALSVLENQAESAGRLLSDKQKEMQRAQLDFSKVSMELRSCMDKRDQAKDQVSQLSTELEEHKFRMHTLKGEKSQSRENEDTLAKDLFRLTEEAKKLKDSYEAGQQALSGIDRELTQAMVDQSARSEKESHARGDLFRARKSIEEKEKDYTASRERIEALLLEAQAKKLALAEKEKTVIVLKKLTEDLKTQIGEDEAKEAAARAKLKDLFTKQQTVSDELSLAQREYDRLVHKKEQLEENLDRKTSYLWDEYEITPSEAEKLKNPEMTDQAELKKQIQSFKSRIRSLGSINTGAVEEYEELMTRLVFYRAQHEDLVAARANLQVLIDQLDADMKKQFAEKFALVKKEFAVVFRELFGGGSADLTLEESDDMLETGILIHVQPPGKKLQNMMQLSGGEKSLTAISLLFAIQNLKPSPFCILDEIEAALDDANVDRFAKYLNKLKINTQFIVITHRRGTMLIADQLYGITMQEKGISSLVSVDLTDEA